VIDGVIEINVETAHAELEEDLGSNDPVTGSHLMHALERCQSRVLLASKLKNKARRDYELFKVDHEQWLEVKKTSAMIALEEEKKEKELKKQITVDMIIDRVRATWPDEYRKRETKLRDFQSAVHTLEDLAEAWKQRSRDLGNLTSIIVSMGASSAPQRGR
jgi:hypothetical protein